MNVGDAVHFDENRKSSGNVCRSFQLYLCGDVLIVVDHFQFSWWDFEKLLQGSKVRRRDLTLNLTIQRKINVWQVERGSESVIQCIACIIRAHYFDIFDTSSVKRAYPITTGDYYKEQH